MRPIDLPDAIDLAVDRTALLDDGQREPVLALVPLSTAADVDADRVRRLDPTRIQFDPELPSPAGRPARGPVGSLILHLLPLLALITWSRPPLDMPTPIPVQLVIEQPPPPPPPPPQPQAEPKSSVKPPPGRLSSDDFAETQGPKTDKGAGEAEPSKGAPQPPVPETQAAEPAPPTPPAPETQTAAAAPPKPAPPVEQSTGMPQPPPAETQITEAPPKPAPPPPKTKPPKQQTALRMPQPLGDVWPLPLHPSEARRTAAHIGPTATRDEYCAYALSLTLRHLDLLPDSLIAARRGTTVVSLRVRYDGTVENVMIARSSGYPDIDERVEKMVLAVGRFPPLPQWVPGQWMDFTFKLHFPHDH